MVTYVVTFGLRYAGKRPIKTADNISALTFLRRQNYAIFSLGNEARHYRSSIGLMSDIAMRHYRVTKLAPKFTCTYMHVYICICVKNVCKHH